MYCGYTWLFKHFCFVAATADEVENYEEFIDSVSYSTVPHSTQFVASHQYMSPDVAASKTADKRG